MGDTGDTSTVTSVTRAPRRRRPPARLVVVHAPAAATPIPLAGGKVVLGRVGGDAIGIADPTISRRHFSVSWDPTIWHHVGEDLHSKNGTWIGGVKLVSAARGLVDGDVIRLGDTLLVYEVGSEVAEPDDVARGAVPGDSAAARTLRARITAVARDPAPVLLCGETGTGKEHIAGEIHRLSGRRGPFLAVNCAELNAALIESQLFGHGRGAFTGADREHAGLFRSAAGGTLLLDEIGELPLELQPKLLRVLQEREVLPVGDGAAVVVDVRVVAATNSDLPARVRAGTFRRDLYARLALLEVAVPPLRARRADVLAWVQRLFARWQEQRPGRPAGGRLALGVEAAEALLLAPWPDNLRGLDRLVHQLATGSGDTPVTPAQLAGLLPPPEAAAAPPPAMRPPVPTREELATALEAHAGSIRALAKHFARDRKQIYRWLKDHGLR